MYALYPAPCPSPSSASFAFQYQTCPFEQTTFTALRCNAAVLGEVDAAAENAEFEFEFHPVYQSFVCGLDVVQARVFEVEDGEIKEGNDGVDMDEMGHDFSRCLL
jgi:hypothetical protein